MNHLAILGVLFSASLKPRQLRRLLGTCFVDAGCRASPELHCPHPSHQSCPGHAGSWCPAAKDSLSEDAARLGILLAISTISRRECHMPQIATAFQPQAAPTPAALWHWLCRRGMPCLTRTALPTSLTSILPWTRRLLVSRGKGFAQ